MSLVSRDAGAAVAPHPLAHWLADRRVRRFAAAFAAGVSGELFNWAAWGLLEFLRLPVTAFVSFACGLLLGWPGILGAAAGQALTLGLLHGRPALALALAASIGTSGVVSWLVFRGLPRLGRGLPDLRSYLWLLASALAGGLLGGIEQTRWLGEPLVPTAGTGTVAALVSAVLWAPPVLLAADRWLRPFLARIPGEEPARRSRRLSGGLPERPDLGEQTVLVARPQPEVGKGLALGAAGVLLATLPAVAVTALVPQGGSWALLLYLGPILWSALNYGLRGGVLAASGSGLLYLFGIALLRGTIGLAGGSRLLWGFYATLLILSLIGALVGAAREEEAHLREELLSSNRLLRRDLLRVAQALTQAIEAKDSYTEGHLRRVSEYAVAVGSRLGLHGHDLEMLHYASMLHDIGKIAVPETVLRKQGPLDDDEAEVMRRHPEVGARMLSNLDLLSDAAPLVLHHQERWDGAGYPGRVAGEAIPLGARIIAVVDAFDAMTTDRPYRQALPVERATAELTAERGRQFDPRVVDAFLEILAERPWRRA